MFHAPGHSARGVFFAGGQPQGGISMTESARNTRTLTLTAMLATMAYVAMLVTRPLPNIAGFLSYDLKDVVVVIAGFQLGVIPALLITLVVSLLEMVTVSSTGPIGLLMNVLSTGAFVLPAALMYQRNRSLKSASIGLGFGVILMTVVSGAAPEMRLASSREGSIFSIARLIVIKAYG